MAYAATPYRSGIPKWAKITGVLVLVFMQYFISGLNGDIGPRVASYFGLDSGKVSFFLSISAIGMIAIFPLSYRFRAYFRRINLLMTVLGLQLLISLLCAFAYNDTLLLLSSLFTGGLKIIVILDLFSMAVGLFPFLRKDRGLFYGFLYAFLRIAREASTYVNLNLIDRYGWTAPLILSAVLALLSIFICLALFHGQRMQRKIPLYQIDWLGIFLFLILGVSLCYTLTMGKEKNWLESTEILVTALISLFSGVLFVYREFMAKRPLWDLRAFKIYKQIALGFVLMLFMYFFYKSSMIYNGFFDYNFKNEENYLAFPAIVHISTYLLFFPLAGILFYKGISKRLLLFIGFMSSAVGMISLSFLIQPHLRFKPLIVPLILISIGYAFSLTTLAAYMATNIPRKDNINRVMASVSSRYVFGLVISIALYGNWLFRQTRHVAAALSRNLTPIKFHFSRQWALISGAFSTREAGHQRSRRQALQLLHSKLHLQATLVSMKEMLFTIGLIAMALAIIVLFIRLLEKHKIKGRNQYRIIPW